MVMIQINILSGKKAGAQSAARHFPFRIGRAEQNDLRLEDDGVWDQHLVFEFQKQEGFKLMTSANAIATVNGEPIQNKILRNGDIITLGSAKLQFWLAAAQQRGLRSGENFVWTLLIFVTLWQLILIYWLLR
jgi:pSer/pThr/pTyr-binding forkhead associated (FHA) protein